MTDDPLTLAELERDALTEIVNIGVSRAAASLRKMVNEQVLLSVPAIDVVSQARAARLISERELTALVAVKQDFAGAFAGRALLIFPEEDSLELARAVTHDELDAKELLEMEHEALVETGNVILNSCLATMANMLQQSLTMTIPEVIRGNSQMLFADWADGPSDGLVLFFYIDFTIRYRNIRGYIAILMNLPALAVLKQLIADFIVRIVGNDG
jgi:chemotaxis protein CheC